MEGGLTPERASVEAAQRQARLVAELRWRSHLLYPSHLLSKEPWDKWMGPGMPGPFEQECWAEEDRDHQDFTWLYQEHSDDTCGPGAWEGEETAKFQEKPRAVPSGQEDTIIREPVYGPMSRYSHGFL